MYVAMCHYLLVNYTYMYVAMCHYLLVNYTYTYVAMCHYLLVNYHITLYLHYLLVNHTYMYVAMCLFYLLVNYTYTVPSLLVGKLQLHVHMWLCVTTFVCGYVLVFCCADHNDAVTSL